MKAAGEASGGDEELRVVRAEAGDVPVLSLVIAEAFGELEPSRWLIPRADRRREILPGYFRLLLEHAIAAGVVHTTPRRTGAALWLPGGEGTADLPEEYQGRLAAVTDSWASRFAVFDTALERRHPAGPHQYLAVLAVRPDQQGRGTGTALLRARHEVLDREPGTVAYLEASSRRVRHLYLAQGYVDHGLPVQLPSGPAMYPMIRQPRVRAS